MFFNLTFLLFATNTSSANIITSTPAGGLWSAGGTWVGGNPPALNDDVIIADGATVTINISPPNLTSLTVGQGGLGILTFDGGTIWAVVVTGSVTIAAGGTLIVPATGTVTNTFSIGGDLINNGTFDMSLGGTTSLCTVTFNKVGNQNISGTTPVLTRFRSIVLDKGAIGNKVLCSIDVSISGSNAITYTNGTWEQTAKTLTVTSASQAIGANGAWVFSNSGSLNMTIAGSIACSGILTINTSGTFSMGSGNNSITTVGTHTLNFTAGTVNIYGRLQLTLGNTTINGANIKIDPQSTNTLGPTSSTFEISGTANVTFSSGSVTLVDPNAAATTGRDLKIGTTVGTVNLSGGTIYFGDGSSTSTSSTIDGYLISNPTATLVPLGNIVVQGGNIAGRNVRITTYVLIGGILALTSGTVDVDVNTMTINNGGSISGGSSSSYILCSSTLSNLIQYVGSSDVFYPVGTKVGNVTSYSPVTLNNNGGTADNFKVRASTGFDFNDPPYTNQVVNRVWEITEGTSGGSNATIKLQWNTPDETGTYNGFIRTNPVYIGRYNGSVWEETAASYTDLGGGVYTASAGGFTAFSPFAVGNMSALPVELSSFTSNVNGRDVSLNWTTKTEKNSNSFVIERTLPDGNVNKLKWDYVASVKSAFSSNTPRQYSYIDKNLQAGKYQYRLKMLDIDGFFEYSKVIETEIALPGSFELSQNYPNAFNTSTKINYSLPLDSKVTLEIYNITGVRIRQLVNEDQSAGYYSVDFNASKLSSGIYFYRITTVDKAAGNNFSATKKMIFLK